MSKKKIDLSGIKEKDLDKTSSFTDLMTKKERKNRNSNDIDDMVNEKRKATKDLTNELREAKEIYKKDLLKEESEENLGKTQILELTRQMKFNLEETKEKNNQTKKHGFSLLNIIGELNLLCMGYYIYLLAFTNYQDVEVRYLINGGIIISLVLLFGLSVVTSKKISKIFYILNIIAIIVFIIFNTYTLIY